MKIGMNIEEVAQLIVIYSKSTIDSPEYMFKVNNKKTRTTS